MKGKVPPKPPAMVTQEIIDGFMPMITADLTVMTPQEDGKSAGSMFIRDIAAVYLKLLKTPVKEERLAMMKELFKGRKEKLNTAKDFIGVVNMGSSTIYNSRIFEDRQRPTLKAAKRVLESAGIVGLQNGMQYYHRFGLHPGEETKEAKDARKQKIAAKLETIAAPNDVSLKKKAYQSFFLGMSERRMQNLTSGNQKTSPANAYHFIVALAKSTDAADMEDLYHLFGYHPIKDGEADLLLQVCAAYFRRFLQAIRIQSSQKPKVFWGLVYVLTDYFDEYFERVCAGAVILPGMREKLDMPASKYIYLLPQMFYKEEEEIVDEYYDLLLGNGEEEALLKGSILPV